jgi:hypothetical protein
MTLCILIRILNPDNGSRSKSKKINKNIPVLLAKLIYILQVKDKR